MWRGSCFFNDHLRSSCPSDQLFTTGTKLFRHHIRDSCHLPPPSLPSSSVPIRTNSCIVSQTNSLLSAPSAPTPLLHPPRHVNPLSCSSAPGLQDTSDTMLWKSRTKNDGVQVKREVGKKRWVYFFFWRNIFLLRYIFFLRRMHRCGIKEWFSFFLSQYGKLSWALLKEWATQCGWHAKWEKIHYLNF